MRLRTFFCLAWPLVSATPTQLSGWDEPFFYKGHDLSSLKMLVEGGCIYKDMARNNETRPAESILGDGGMNAIRLRIWVNPVGETYGLKYNLDLAKQFQDEGYKIYLDFHFSDSWADPTKQPPPAAWPTTLGSLASTLREYVKDTLVAFKQAGIKLDIPLGYANVDVEPWPKTVANFSNLAFLWKAARAGVDDAISAGVPKPQVLIHIDDGWNLTLQQRWFGAMVDNGLPTTAWDVFGFSFYPFYGTAATFDNLRTTLNTLAEQYQKPLQVVETDYPAICDGKYEPIPPSSEPEIPYDGFGQTTWTDDVISIVQQVPNALGQGVFYWEPAWLNNTSLGSACEDAILFSADYSNPEHYVGYSRTSVDMFNVQT